MIDLFKIISFVKSQILQRTYFLCLFGVLILTSFQIARADNNITVTKTSYFRVSKIEGKATSRAPFALNWIEVKPGTILAFGTSLRIEKSTNLELTYFFSNRGAWKSVQTYLFFNNDATIILNDKIMRKIELKKYFFSSIRHKGDTSSSTAADSADFKKAWNRVAAFFKPKDDSPYSPTLKAQNDGEVQVGLRAKKITVLYPEDGMTKYVRQFPTTLQVIWAKPTETPMDYKIYFWKYNTDYQTPIAVTAKDNYAITVNEPGSYFYQVTSAKESFSSKSNLVHFFPEIPEFATDHTPILKNGVLSYPLPNMALLGESNGNIINFIGQLPPLNTIKNPNLIVVEKGSDQKTTSKLPHQEKVDLQLKLPAGHFEWWLEFAVEKDSVGHDGKSEKKLELSRSETRRFDIISAGKSAQDQNIIVERLVQDFITKDKPVKVVLSRSKDIR